MQSKKDITTNLVGRLDWWCARRDDRRIARHGNVRSGQVVQDGLR
jgi:hypothetical protein